MLLATIAGNAWLVYYRVDKVEEHAEKNQVRIEALEKNNTEAHAKFMESISRLNALMEMRVARQSP